MVQEVIEHLNWTNADIVIDATVGLGGHAEAILKHNEDVSLIGLDRDEQSLAKAAKRLKPFGKRVRLLQANFADMADVAEEGTVDGIIMDLGISSWQLSERGFSFQKDEPLDFRLDQRQTRTAADLIRGADEKQLADILYQYGEEFRSRRIAKAIVEAGAEAPIDTTQRLAKIIQGAARRQGRIHPATKSFQALRIAVNDELGSLSKGLEAAEELLKPGGRLQVISFHSLEDRLVKEFIKNSTALVKVNKKVIQPAREEIKRNTRARSAKLRVAEKAKPAAPASSARNRPG